MISKCDFTGAATFTSTSNNLAELNVKVSAAVSSALLEETFGTAVNVCQWRLIFTYLFILAVNSTVKTTTAELETDRCSFAYDSGSCDDYMEQVNAKFCLKNRTASFHRICSFSGILTPPHDIAEGEA